MKQAYFVVVLVLAVLISLPIFTYAAEAEKSNTEIIPKEFISSNVPKEVTELLESIEFVLPVETKSYFSGKVPGVNDYGLKEVKTNHGTIKVLFEVSLERDAKGNINPCGCNAVPVAYMFADKKVSWYKDQETKKLFQEAAR